MLINWTRISFYFLIIAAIFVVVGIIYWECQFHESASPGRNEFREGTAYFVLYGWPIFLGLAALSIFGKTQLSKAQLTLTTLLILAFFVFAGVSLL